MIKKRPVNTVARRSKDQADRIGSAGYRSQSQSPNETSICLTEENRHVCMINPMNLADKDWTDPYKLNKLLTQQKTIDADQIFSTQCPNVNQEQSTSEYCPVKDQVDSLFEDLQRATQKHQRWQIKSTDVFSLEKAKSKEGLRYAQTAQKTSKTYRHLDPLSQRVSVAGPINQIIQNQLNARKLIEDPELNKNGERFSNCSDLAEESSSEDDSTFEDVHQFIRNNMNDYETSLSYVAQDKAEESKNHLQRILAEAGEQDGPEEVEQLKTPEQETERVQDTNRDPVFINSSNVDAESTQNDNSFVNMGRPSDMNEDRVISKETRDALVRESVRKELFLQQSEMSQDLKQSRSNMQGDCGLPYGDTIGTSDLRTFDLTNRVTISGKQSSTIISFQAHHLASQQWQKQRGSRQGAVCVER